jgi:hypothetical protein
MAKKRPPKRRPRPTVEVKPERQQFLFQIGVSILILLIYGFYLTQRINLTPVDLGRHLKNGEVFFSNLSVPQTNLYSYTYPDYPFINHHWGSGVIFSLLERLAGFPGISVFFILTSVLTFFLFFNLAIKYSSFEVAAPISLIIIPVLIYRYRIRPEVFTYFLSGLFLQILWNYKYQKLPFRWLFLLPVLEILWVNLHIYFFVGVMLIAVFLFESLILLLINKNEETTTQVKELAVALFLASLATCLNPAGLAGAMYPFNILKEYELPVIENASVWSVKNKDLPFVPVIYFEILFGLLCVSWLYVTVKRGSNFSVANLLITLFFSAIGWWAIRNFAIFAYFALPLAAVNFRGLKINESNVYSLKSKLRVSAILLLLSLAMILIRPTYFLSSGRGPRGIGLEKGTDAAADFFLKENLQGPILNNYDVGSYLIYYLYPRHRVFVDNRPEAYPAAFFRDIYIPLQADEDRWEKIRRVYGFNVILFNHRALWGEQFIVRRVLDPMWAPVYLDKDIIILLKRYGPNQSTITKYELPKEKVLEKAE